MAPDPVSYTHLDVYKRQALSGRVRIGRRAALSDNRSCCGRTSDTYSIGNFARSDGRALR